MGFPSLVQVLNGLRRVVGIFLLILGIFGAILPILPAWPFIVPAILLLGRRDRTLRYTHLLLRRALRRLRHSQTPLLRQLGVWCSREYIRTRRLLTPLLIAAERRLRLPQRSAVRARDQESGANL